MLYILDDLIIDRPWKLWSAYLDKQIMLAVRFVNLLKDCLQKEAVCSFI